MYGIADSKLLITVAPQNEMITVNCLIDKLVSIFIETFQLEA